MGWRLRFWWDIFLFNKFAEKASLTRDSCSYICVPVMFFVCWVGHLQSADSIKKNYFSIGTNFFLKREVNFCVCSSFLYLFRGCIYCINFLFLWYINMVYKYVKKNIQKICKKIRIYNKYKKIYNKYEFVVYFFIFVVYSYFFTYFLYILFNIFVVYFFVFVPIPFFIRC